YDGRISGSGDKPKSSAIALAPKTPSGHGDRCTAQLITTWQPIQIDTYRSRQHHFTENTL
ncbi:MAG: hypothetical protein WAM85_19200, partial [Terracidiphilus sp.]